MSTEIRAVSATVSCSVSSPDGHLSAELDGRAWGYNGGKSQFFEGDSAYFIVYCASNTTIVGSICMGGSLAAFGPNNAENTHREVISFQSPIASSSKPIGAMSVLDSAYEGCGGLIVEGGVTLRLTSWNVTLSPEAVPPFAYVYIAYSPLSSIWVISGMRAIQGQPSSPVHGAIFGKVVAT